MTIIFLAFYPNELKGEIDIVSVRNYLIVGITILIKYGHL